MKLLKAYDFFSVTLRDKLTTQKHMKTSISRLLHSLKQSGEEASWKELY